MLFVSRVVCHCNSQGVPALLGMLLSLLWTPHQRGRRSERKSFLTLFQHWIHPTAARLACLGFALQRAPASSLPHTLYFVLFLFALLQPPPCSLRHWRCSAPRPWGARMQRARREGNPKSHTTSEQGALQLRCNCCSFQSIERDRPTSCDEHARTFTEGGHASHEFETNGQRHRRDGAPSGGSSRWSPTFPRGAQNSGDGAGSSSQRRPPSAGIRTGGDTRRTRRSRGAHTAGHRRRPPPPHLPHTRAGTPARSHTDRGR